MKRMITIIVIFLFGIGSAALVKTQFQQQPEISSTLSARSQEYLSERNDGGSIGKMYLGPEKENPIGKKVMIDTCLSLIVPFSLANERRDKECDYYLGIENPRGNITVYLRKEPSTDWESVPGVSMRRQSSWTYDEKQVIVKGKEFLTFKNKAKDKYEQNAFYRTGSYFVVLNLTAYTNENLDTKFEELLGSVEFLTK